MSGKEKAVEPSILRELLDYNPDTGLFIWRERTSKWFEGRRHPAQALATTWNKRRAEKPAFTASDPRGYLRGGVFNKTYEAGRVAWALYHGNWPIGSIDHINGKTFDNRICNLRDADRTQQARNSGMSKRNKTGVMGVCWDGSRSRWEAFVHLNNKKKFIGRYLDFESAVKARKAAEREYGFHPNHGRAA